MVCQGGHQLVKKIELDFDEGQQITSLPLSMCLTAFEHVFEKKEEEKRERLLLTYPLLCSVYTDC